MVDGWFAFTQSLNPSTIRAQTLPPLGRVIGERFDGPAHQRMLQQHELNRAGFHEFRGKNETHLAAVRKARLESEVTAYERRKRRERVARKQQQLEIAVRAVAGTDWFRRNA